MSVDYDASHERGLVFIHPNGYVTAYAAPGIQVDVVEVRPGETEDDAIKRAPRPARAVYRDDLMRKNGCAWRGDRALVEARKAVHEQLDRLAKLVADENNARLMHEALAALGVAPADMRLAILAIADVSDRPIDAVGRELVEAGRELVRPAPLEPIPMSFSTTVAHA